MRLPFFVKIPLEKCLNCDGSGTILIPYDPSPSGVSLGSGFLYDDEDCPRCRGTGKCTADSNYLLMLEEFLEHEFYEEQRQEWLERQQHYPEVIVDGGVYG